MTPRLRDKVRVMVSLLRDRRMATVAEKLRHNLYSDSLVVCLRRDLDLPFGAPDAAIPIVVRPLRPRDAAVLLEGDRLDADGRYERTARRNLLAAEIPTCWVAATNDDRPCYMQWLIGARDNARIQAYWGGRFPMLAPDHALLEGAFTPEAYRGRGIMPAAMARIAERAADLGARFVVTFVDAGNAASLKGSERAGFRPHGTIRVRHRFFHQTAIEKALDTPIGVTTC